MFHLHIMKIRSALPTDASAITDIHNSSFYGRFRNDANESEVQRYLGELDEAYFSSLIVAQSAVIFVAEEGENIVGFAQLNPEKPSIHLSLSGLKLERLYVYPEQKRKGIGRALMNRCLDYRTQASVDLLWLQVLSSNIEAVQLYEQLGFSTFTKSPGKFEADEAEDFWMQDALSAARWQHN